MEKLISFESCEFFEGGLVQVICDNWVSIIPELLEMDYETPEDDRKKKYDSIKKDLTNYLTSSKPHNEISGVNMHNVKYAYAKKSNNCGRQFSTNSISLQSMPRKIKNTLTHNLYNDIDIKNAMFSILYQYCLKKDYPRKELKKSILHNEEYIKILMDTLNIDRKAAKQIKIGLALGKTKTYDVDWFEPFQKEIKQIHTLIMADEENKYLIAKIKTDKGKFGTSGIQCYNLPGKVCGHIIFNIENLILCSCIEFLKQEKINIEHLVLSFDGFMNLKTSMEVTPEFLENLSACVKSKTGYKMDFVNKPMTEIIDLSKYKIITQPVITVTNDVQACMEVLKAMNGKIYNCNGNLYIKTHNTRIWTLDTNIISKEIMYVMGQLQIFMLSETSKIAVMYSQNVRGMEAVQKLISSYAPENEKLEKHLLKKSKCKLFFKDCVYDFKLGCAREETADDMTPVRIPRDYPTTCDKETETILINLLNSIFEIQLNEDGVIKSITKNWLQHCARALAMHYEDKQFVAIMGARNCGKGIISHLLVNSFDPYVQEFNANNFIKKQRQGEDCAKNLMWTFDLMYARIGISNESDTTVKTDDSINSIIYNGDFIKALTGGDPIRARTLYKTAIKFIFQTRLFFQGNVLPDIYPTDTCEQMTLFNLPSKYLKKSEYEQRKQDNELEDYMRLGDSEIKNKIIKRKFTDAFTRIVLSMYTENPVVDVKEIADIGDNYKFDQGDELTIYKSMFDFSDTKAEMFSEDVNKLLKDRCPNMSSQKVKRFLTANMRVTLKKQRLDGQCRQVYTGIKIKQKIEHKDQKSVVTAFDEVDKDDM